MTISPVEEPSGGIPVFTDHPDQAYLIIESTINNLSFSSNMEGIVDNRSDPSAGRYVFIIRPFTQIFTVSAPGYVVGRFRLQTPQIRNTYHYRITPVETSDDLIPVNFIVTPPDATLFLANQEVLTGQTVRLPSGSHPIRIEKAGYRSISQSITIQPDNTLFQFSMEELFELPVTIRSNPPDATVYVNTVRQNRSTTFQDFFYPGEYIIRLTKSGYRDIERQIRITEDGSNDFMFDLQRFAGTLHVSVNPADARLILNNQEYNHREPVSLTPGTYNLLVERDGYHTHTERITIREDDPLSRQISLRAMTGVLIFSIDQPDADVSIFDSNNQLIANWNGINRIPDLPVGNYRYTATMPGFESRQGTFSIRDGATERISAQLGDSLPGQASTNPATTAATQTTPVSRSPATPPAQLPQTAAPTSSSQNSQQRPASDRQNRTGATESDIFDVVNRMPEAVGGVSAIYRSIRYPNTARRAGIQGVVLVQFVVEPNGRVSTAEVVRGIGGGCDEEAVRAVLASRWTPGVQHDDTPVRVRMTLPIRFTLDGR